KELDAAKSDFFANVSHELRTPLALILGPAEKLQADEQLGTAPRRELGTIVRNARVLLKHVNDLLDVARVDAGHMPVVYAECDLAALVRGAAAHFESLAGARGVDFTIEAPDRLPAQLDAAQIERVVLNLVGNAFKFVPDGGRVCCALAADGG